MPQQSAADLYNQLIGITNQYKDMGTIDPTQVRQQLLEKVDNFRPLYTDARNAEAEAYAAPASVMKSYSDLFGNSPTMGPSGFGRLSAATNEIGRKMATAGTLGDIINVQGGRLNDLAGSVVSRFNAGRDALKDQYGFISPLFQSALQQEDAAKQRAATQASTDAYNKLLGFQTQSAKMPPGTVVGSRMIIGYDANGNPIWGDIVNKAGQGTAQPAPSTMPKLVAAPNTNVATPSWMLGQNLGVSNYNPANPGGNIMGNNFSNPSTNNPGNVVKSSNIDISKIPGFKF